MSINNVESTKVSRLDSLTSDIMKLRYNVSSKPADSHDIKQHKRTKSEPYRMNIFKQQSFQYRQANVIVGYPDILSITQKSPALRGL
ncbi:hypothetical protein VA7868_01886 [Vibrio aerogenes CECT 7868]|uniref:Uncharacterized protein n=1 Tax=Vibrio aerogenes CECT 7868 TaxID=1216006 RepID=A0A1M5YN73_9VIBR|nr:hypothetical protein VA7868_01886 [Vibrio aerogenes CECT 7868]